jgi:hypothetical protein
VRLLVTFLAALTVVSAAPGQAERTRIRAVDLAPVTVRGSGFVAGERVRVTVSAKVSSAKSVSTTAAGTWRVVFARSLNGCQSYAIRAVGNRGSHAFLKVMPECPPIQPAGP